MYKRQVFGDTPFSETGVLNPDGTPKYMQPKIDSQESIYKEVMQNLDAAITLLKDGTAEDEGLSGAVGSKDLIYGSDQDEQAGLWLKTAYALKARHTMPVSYTHLDVYKRQGRLHPLGTQPLGRI